MYGSRYHLRPRVAGTLELRTKIQAVPAGISDGELIPWVGDGLIICYWHYQGGSDHEMLWYKYLGMRANIRTHRHQTSALGTLQ